MWPDKRNMIDLLVQMKFKSNLLKLLLREMSQDKPQPLLSDS